MNGPRRGDGDRCESSGAPRQQLPGRQAAGGPAPSAAATRAALAAAADGLAAARAAKALLDEKLSDQRTAVATAQAFARRAAIARAGGRAAGADCWPRRSRPGPPIAKLSAGLAWLLRSGAIPSSDARARQLVAGADTPPSAWPEARTAGTPAMEAALAALLGE